MNLNKDDVIKLNDVDINDFVSITKDLTSRTFTIKMDKGQLHDYFKTCDYKPFDLKDLMEDKENHFYMQLHTNGDINDGNFDIHMECNCLSPKDMIYLIYKGFSVIEDYDNPKFLDRMFQLCQLIAMKKINNNPHELDLKVRDWHLK